MCIRDSLYASESLDELPLELLVPLEFDVLSECLCSTVVFSSFPAVSVDSVSVLPVSSPDNAISICASGEFTYSRFDQVSYPSAVICMESVSYTHLVSMLSMISCMVSSGFGTCKYSSTPSDTMTRKSPLYKSFSLFSISSL